VKLPYRAKKNAGMAGTKPIADQVLLELPAGPNEVIRVMLSTYAGVQRLDLRRWWRPDPAAPYRATQKGVSIRLSELVQLRVAVQLAEQLALEAGVLKEADYELAAQPLPAQLLT